MNGAHTSAVSATTAHHEWASRPHDERYDSVPALYEAAQCRVWGTDTVSCTTREIRTIPVGENDLAVRGPSGEQWALTHWSCDQLARLAGAPAGYLRKLPATIASQAINHGLTERPREPRALFTNDGDDDRSILRAITSPRYTRIHHVKLLERVMDLMAQHPAWQLPLGYKDGVYGAERVPSGAYLGDRDMFLFLVDGNRDLEDPSDPSQAGLFRGFILRNSDVGAAALTLDIFLFRAVCSNHLIWGFEHVAGFRRRHVGRSIWEAWTSAMDEVQTALDADPTADRARLRRASAVELGATRDAVVTAGVRRLGLSRKQADSAYAEAEVHESNPRSIWGYVQGLTRLSQRTPWQDERFALDQAASRLVTTVH